MNDISRRRFFKRFGMIAGCAVIAPNISLERLEHPDFVPGCRKRQGARTWFATDDFKTTVNEHKIELKNWLKTKVPRGFRHGKTLFRSKLVDYDTGIGTMIDYQAPKNYKL